MNDPFEKRGLRATELCALFAPMLIRKIRFTVILGSNLTLEFEQLPPTTQPERPTTLMRDKLASGPLE